MTFHIASGMADLEILTINAGKITTAEKHIADSLFPAYNRLLAVVNTNRTDIETGITSAYTNLTMQPVNITAAWTNTTRSQRLNQKFKT
jgi:predicted GTPase